jgi:hypothetical protein
MPRNGSGSYSLPTNSWNPSQNNVPATAVDWQALANDLASALTQSLSRDGQTAYIGNQPMGGNKLTGLGAGSAAGDSLRFEQLFSQGIQQDLASASVLDIGAVNSTVVNITGTTTITSFGTVYNGPRYLRFAGVLTLTNSATLVLPGNANITTAAGDSAIAVPLGNPATGWRVVGYVRAADVPGAPADNSVSTPKLADDAVTFAKMQNIATARLLGRATAETGDVEELAAIPAGVDVPADRLSGDVAAARITNALNASGSAPIYACRAWVNFNGTGTVAIRASGNVSSITDNGVGDYTVNFTTAMPDANYSVVAMAGGFSSGQAPFGFYESSNTSRTTSLVRLFSSQGASAFDGSFESVAIFR